MYWAKGNVPWTLVWSHSSASEVEKLSMMKASPGMDAPIYEPKVLMTPRNEENPYLGNLMNALVEQGIDVDFFEMNPTSSQTLNAFLVPFLLIKERISGAGILHIHWVYQFAMPSLIGFKLTASIPRLWFGFCLQWARLFGFRIVATIHDVVPLVQVFDDDDRARRTLIKYADSVIAITDQARLDIARRFNTDLRSIHSIPEGAPVIPSAIGSQKSRAELGLDSRPLIVLAGRQNPYKGADLLLEACGRLPAKLNVQVVVAGAAADLVYADKIRKCVANLQNANRHATWLEGSYTERTYDLLLSAANVVAIPFRWITNSTTVRQAMARGVLVVIPNLPALADIPMDGCVRFESTDSDGLTLALERSLNMSNGERRHMIHTARQWATAWSWNRVAEETAEIYREVLHEDH